MAGLRWTLARLRFNQDKRLLRHDIETAINGTPPGNLDVSINLTTHGCQGANYHNGLFIFMVYSCWKLQVYIQCTNAIVPMFLRSTSFLKMHIFYFCAKKGQAVDRMADLARLVKYCKYIRHRYAIDTALYIVSQFLPGVAKCISHIVFVWPY